MASVPKKPGVHKVGGRYFRRFANGKVQLTKAPRATASTGRRRSPAKTARRAPTRTRKRSNMPRIPAIAKNPVVAGALAGAAASYASRLSPQFGPAIGLGAVGYMMKDKALQTMAGVSIGSQLAPGGALGSGGVL